MDKLRHLRRQMVQQTLQAVRACVARGATGKGPTGLWHAHAPGSPRQPRRLRVARAARGSCARRERGAPRTPGRRRFARLRRFVRAHNCRSVLYA
jgi:hypothetical protein